MGGGSLCGRRVFRSDVEPSAGVFRGGALCGASLLERLLRRLLSELLGFLRALHVVSFLVAERDRAPRRDASLGSWRSSRSRTDGDRTGRTRTLSIAPNPTRMSLLADFATRRRRRDVRPSLTPAVRWPCLYHSRSTRSTNGHPGRGPCERASTSWQGRTRVDNQFCPRRAYRLRSRSSSRGMTGSSGWSAS